MFQYRRGAWQGIEVAWNDRRRSLSLRLAPGSRMIQEGARRIEVKLGSATKSAAFAGRPVGVRF